MNSKLVICLACGAFGVATITAPDRILTAADVVADFRDIATSAGLTARTIIGGDQTKQYILETTGGGAAILDYDDDGWSDIFLVNGAPLEKPGSAGSNDRPTSHLYRNQGDGTFADVTAKAGVGG